MSSHNVLYSQYEPLPDQESKLLSRVGDDDPKHDAWRDVLYKRAIILLLGLSLAANVSFVVHSTLGRSQSHHEGELIGLRKTVPTRWEKYTPFNSENRTEEDRVWRESPGYINDVGVVALSASDARKASLVDTQAWPVDQTKGIYVLEGIHVMHCLRLLRSEILNVFDGNAPKIHLWHHKHCLDTLRQFIMCNADESLRYTGSIHEEANEILPVPGIGSQRMCKSWDKLVDWAIDNSACFHQVTPNSTVLGKEDFGQCPHR